MPRYEKLNYMIFVIAAIYILMSPLKQISVLCAILLSGFIKESTILKYSIMR